MNQVMDLATKEVILVCITFTNENVTKLYRDFLQKYVLVWFLILEIP